MPCWIFWQVAQLPTGELPYIVDGPHEKGRIHYLCYQYNAFQFLKLAWAAALRPDPRTRRILSALAGFLAKGVTKSGASAADCSQRAAGDGLLHRRSGRGTAGGA